METETAKLTSFYLGYSRRIACDASVSDSLYSGDTLVREIWEFTKGIGNTILIMARETCCDRSDERCL
jgi:hypothetical protein